MEKDNEWSMLVSLPLHVLFNVLSYLHPVELLRWRKMNRWTWFGFEQTKLSKNTLKDLTDCQCTKLFGNSFFGLSESIWEDSLEVLFLHDPRFEHSYWKFLEEKFTIAEFYHPQDEMYYDHYCEMEIYSKPVLYQKFCKYCLIPFLSRNGLCLGCHNTISDLLNLQFNKFYFLYYF